MSQLASVVGVYGLTFIAALLSVTPALIWPADGRTMTRRLVPFFAAVVVIAAQVAKVRAAARRRRGFFQGARKMRLMVGAGGRARGRIFVIEKAATAGGAVAAGEAGRRPSQEGRPV